MSKLLTLNEFLDKKQDYSPFLVHLTKDSPDIFGGGSVPAKDVFDAIMRERKLKAFNYHCLFGKDLDNRKGTQHIVDRFKVVCFTETPIDQIGILLREVLGRRFQPKPYGLIFKKDYIREKGGNHVLYLTKETANPLWRLYWPLFITDVTDDTRIDPFSPEGETICRLLALVSLCKEGNDWHWEREWRIVRDFQFNLSDIYCGLCPEEDIEHFEKNYPPVKFISPDWSTNKILAKGVGK